MTWAPNNHTVLSNTKTWACTAKTTGHVPRKFERQNFAFSLYQSIGEEEWSDMHDFFFLNCASTSESRRPWVKVTDMRRVSRGENGGDHPSSTILLPRRAVKHGDVKSSPLKCVPLFFLHDLVVCCFCLVVSVIWRHPNEARQVQHKRASARGNLAQTKHSLL